MSISVIKKVHKHIKQINSYDTEINYKKQPLNQKKTITISIMIILISAKLRTSH